MCNKTILELTKKWLEIDKYGGNLGILEEYFMETFLDFLHRDFSAPLYDFCVEMECDIITTYFDRLNHPDEPLCIGFWGTIEKLIKDEEKIKVDDKMSELLKKCTFSSGFAKYNTNMNAVIIDLDSTAFENFEEDGLPFN